jgi:hypothetical protein
VVLHILVDAQLVRFLCALVIASHLQIILICLDALVGHLGLVTLNVHTNGARVASNNET